MAVRQARLPARGRCRFRSAECSGVAVGVLRRRLDPASHRPVPLVAPSGVVDFRVGNTTRPTAKHGQARRDVPLPWSGGLQAAALPLPVGSAQAPGYSGRMGPVARLESSLPRVRGFSVSIRTFRRVALANVLWLFVIVSSGATVRLTGSGLGCEHWPGCNAGTRIFPTGYHSYVEFSNRVVSGVAVFVALGTWLLALAAPLRRWVRVAAGLAFAGTLAEAPLGAVTVKYHLDPWLVGSHFLLSLAVLALGVLVLLDAWSLHGDRVPAWVRSTGLVVGPASIVLVLTGTFAT